jgi:hypothetical protein
VVKLTHLVIEQQIKLEGMAAVGFKAIDDRKITARV